jgi:glycosyltransferase involved in cell wall biosynthesis
MLYGPRVDQWIRLFAGSRRRLAPLAERLTGVAARLDLSFVGPCLFPSETVRRRASAAVAGLGDTEVVHQGVDRALFPAAVEKPWDWRLLHVGRIDPRKGIDAAILALTMLPEEARLRIVGGGDEGHLRELRELADRSGVADRVTFTKRGRAELAEEYAGADALVFPVRWVEPWGLVPLEAMSVGLPVIATGSGGSGEYLRHEENSLIFDDVDGPAALASAVRRLADDPELRANLREGGFRTIAGIDPGEFDRAVERLLERAVEGGGSR